MKILKTSHRKTKNTTNRFVTYLVLAVMVILGSVSLKQNTPLAHAQTAGGCATAPAATYGKVTQSVSVATAGTYRVWSRIKAPDTVANSYVFGVDGNCFFTVGNSSSIPANAWTWVNYQNASTASPINVTLTAGTHTLTYTGTEANVQLDKVMLLVDTTCVPTTFGDNCAPTDTTSPTVSITSPASGSTATGSVTINATASDASGVAKVDFLVDGSVVGTDTSSAYSFAWNSATVSNGSHTLQAKAYDTAGNVGTSTGVSVNVSNSNPTPPPPTTGSADLIVTNISWTPASPATGNLVTFSATIKNQGTAATPNVKHGIAFSVDGTLVNWSDNNLTSLAAGASRTQTANGGPAGISTWTATSGTHTILAYVDDSKIIPESNDTNNTLTATLTTGTGTTATPTVSITAPASGSSVASGSVVTINATAASGSSTTTVSKVEFYVDGTLGSTDTTAPYSYSWTATTAGAHGLTAKAYNSSGASTTSSPVSVTVTSATGGGTPGDVNGDSRVNALDLSAIISHDGQNYPAADFNNDGTVGAADLAILLAHWTW